MKQQPMSAKSGSMRHYESLRNIEQGHRFTPCGNVTRRLAEKRWTKPLLVKLSHDILGFRPFRQHISTAILVKVKFMALIRHSFCATHISKYLVWKCRKQIMTVRRHPPGTVFGPGLRYGNNMHSIQLRWRRQNLFPKNIRKRGRQKCSHLRTFNVPPL